MSAGKKIGCGCLYSLFLCVLLSFGTLIVAGAIAGAIAGMKDPQNAEEAGRKAGEQIGLRFGPIIFLAAPFVSLALGFGIAVAGAYPGGRLFPWGGQSTPPANLPPQTDQHPGENPNPPPDV